LELFLIHQFKIALIAHQIVPYVPIACFAKAVVLVSISILYPPLRINALALALLDITLSSSVQVVKPVFTRVKLAAHL
jgi:hypothetical protein